MPTIAPVDQPPVTKLCVHCQVHRPLSHFYATRCEAAGYTRRWVGTLIADQTIAGDGHLKSRRLPQSAAAMSARELKRSRQSLASQRSQILSSSLHERDRRVPVAVNLRPLLDG